MRMRLYEFVVSNGRRVRVHGYLVSPSKERAEEYLGVENIHRLSRVDETVPVNMRHGIDALLEGAPVGMASYHADIGWIPHVAPLERLSLFRIEVHGGEDVFVISPTIDMAVAIFMTAFDLAEGEHQLFRVHDGLNDLDENKHAGLTNLLDFGPVGVVIYDDEHGWLLT